MYSCKLTLVFLGVNIDKKLITSTHLLNFSAAFVMHDESIGY